MAIFLSHMSAADFWRTVYSVERAPGVAPCTVPFGESSCHVNELAANRPAWLNDWFLDLNGGRLHTLASSNNQRGRSQSIAPHVWGGPLPEGAFYRLSDQLYIASPAFAFLQLATSLNLTQLIAFGYELCGRYAFDPREDRGFRTRKVPLTTPERLKRFLESAVGAWGAKHARKALMHVAENSESPMETATHLFLSLPYQLGGYGIPGLHLNQDIPLSTKAASIAKRQWCRADLSLENAALDVEFAGKYDHEGSNALERDRRRTNALIKEGYEVLELTSGQVRDWATFEQIALHIATHAGKRIERKYRGPLPARLGLRKDVFGWNEAYGHISPASGQQSRYLRVLAQDKRRMGRVRNRRRIR